MKPVTDPALIEQLESKAVTDPELIQQLEDAPSVLGEIAGAAETAGTILSGAIAEPVSGIVGLASVPFVGGEKAADIVRSVGNAMTYKPETPQGQRNMMIVGNALKPVGDALQSAEQFTGDIGYDLAGPVGGAVGSAIPAAGLELLGLKGARRISKTPDSIPNVGIDETPTPRDFQTVTENIDQGNAKPLAEAVDADPEILKSAEALDIELTPGATSTNRAFIDLEQSLKSRPGSLIGMKEEKAIRDLGDRANSLIEELGGSSDKSLVDAKTRDHVSTTIEGMTEKADVLYRQVEESIIPATPVKPSRVEQYLEQKLSELGGDESLLTLAEKRLKALVENGGEPTYAALDRVRKNVGEGFKRRGVFADDEIGTLEKVYAALIKDQQAAADFHGVGEQFKAASQLVFNRKDLEKKVISLYGRDFRGSLISSMNNAAVNLPKGDVSKFSKLMEAVPRELQGEVAATLLNDIFGAGSRNKQSLGGGFVRAYEGLNKNTRAKAELFKYLPDGAMERFDTIGRVATGIFRAKALENTSRTARDIIAAMDSGGMFQKVYNVSQKAAVAEAVSSAVGFPGAGTAGVIGSTLAKSRTPATQAADAFIASDKFSKAVKAYAIGKTKQADELLKNSKVYKQWAKYLPDYELDKISKRGFIPWLVGSSGLTGDEE